MDKKFGLIGEVVLPDGGQDLQATLIPLVREITHVGSAWFIYHVCLPAVFASANWQTDIPRSIFFVMCVKNYLLEKLFFLADILLVCFRLLQSSGSHTYATKSTS